MHMPSSHSSWGGGNINHTHSSIGSSRNGSSRAGTSYKKADEEFLTNQGGILSYIYAFSFEPMCDHLKGTRCKPWDNREMDILDGWKANAFILYTISQTAVMILFGVLINLFGIFKLLRNLFITVVMSLNMALEIFIFISAFLGFYKAM